MYVKFHSNYFVWYGLFKDVEIQKNNLIFLLVLGIIFDIIICTEIIHGH